MRFRSVLAAMLVAALPLGATAAAGAQEADAKVTVVHGVPELEVDVYVNGDAAIEGFAFGDVAGPLALPAGDYLLEVRPAGAAPDSEAVLSGEATLAGGDDATVVAHLTEDGDPTLGVFVNPTEPTMDGEGRVVVRHTAAAPAVDILADGAPLAEGLANPDEAIAEVPAATYAVEVVPSGADEAVLAADLPVTEGVTTIVYAIGVGRRRVAHAGAAVDRHPGRDGRGVACRADRGGRAGRRGRLDPAVDPARWPGARRGGVRRRQGASRLAGLIFR